MISENSYNPDTPIVKSTLMMSSTLIVFAAATLTPALPAMQDHFADVENAGLLVKLVVAIPSLFILIGAPLVGILVDKVGRKSVLVVSIILFGLFGTVGFFIPSLFGILVTRAFLGLAIAGITTTVTTLIGDYYSGQTRIELLGLQAAFIGIGAVVALVIGGVLADFNWRNPFLIHLLAFLILPLILFALQEPQRLATKPQLSTESAEETPNQQSKNIEVPVKLLAFIFTTALLGEVALYLVPLDLPFYLQAMTDTNAKQNSLAIAAMTLFFIIGSLLFPKLKQKLDYMTTLVLSLALIGISYEIVGFVNNYILVLLGLTITGLGAGFLVPNLDAWLTASVPGSFRGRAVGGLTAATFLGQFLSPIVSQPVIDNLGLNTATAYGLIYILSGGLLIIFLSAILIALLIKKQEWQVNSQE